MTLKPGLLQVNWFVRWGVCANRFAATAMRVANDYSDDSHAGHGNRSPAFGADDRFKFMTQNSLKRFRYAAGSINLFGLMLSAGAWAFSVLHRTHALPGTYLGFMWTFGVFCYFGLVPVHHCVGRGRFRRRQMGLQEEPVFS